jgi:hypothetical protein
MQQNIITFLLIMLSLSTFIALFLGIKSAIKASDVRFTKLWKLKKHGLIAKGVLIKTTSTGFGDEQEVEMLFEVRSNQNEVWSTKFTACVLIEHAYMLKPGTVFDILYDPDDRSNSMIKWP